jgi:hypothetical protein
VTDPDAEGGEDEIITTDFSLGGEHLESAYADFVEADPISADDYFALTDKEKYEVARGERGFPIGYWWWSKEAHARYLKENPRQEPYMKRRAEREAAPATFSAQPYVRRDPKTIPPRQWLHAGHYIRGFLSATIAPGGLGKTSLQLVEAVGMVLGRDLLKGTTAPPLNVWYWNLEDPADELDRRIAAILLHYNIAPGSSNGRLFVNSEEPLVIATMARNSTAIAGPVVGRLMSEIVRLRIDALIVDPPRSVWQRRWRRLMRRLNRWRGEGNISACSKGCGTRRRLKSLTRPAAWPRFLRKMAWSRWPAGRLNGTVK